MRFSRTRRSPGQSMIRIPPCQNVDEPPKRSESQTAAANSCRELGTEVPPPRRRWHPYRTPGYRSFARAGSDVHTHHRYYSLRRLPLRARPFRGLHLSASRLTGHRRLADLRPLAAGAQTDLSCSMLGCANVPIPLRRTVPRGCTSKIFTPSMAFAQG